MISSTHYLLAVKLRRQQAGEQRDKYPFDTPAIKQLETLSFHPNVTFIVGENGSGKSTLLEAIAIGMGFNPEGGSRNFHFSTSDTHSSLHEHLVLQKSTKRPRDGYFLRAESFYNVATQIDQLEAGTASYGGKSLHAQSHGEAFLSLVGHRFSGNGLYILDEPEAALSPSRQLTLLAHIQQLVAKNSQFIIVTHSPILMGYPDATILSIGENGIQQVAYEETTHFQITQQFMQGRQSILRRLLQDESSR
jgi:predicted ATPase